MQSEANGKRKAKLRRQSCPAPKGIDAVSKRDVMFHSVHLVYFVLQIHKLRAPSFKCRLRPVSASYRRTAAPRTPIAIIPLIPAVTIGARPALVALAAAALADDIAELTALFADDSAELAAPVAELSAALREERMEAILALSVAAWDTRIEDAAGQSVFVETEAMKEPRTAPREVASTRTLLPVTVVRA
jgi:hypothetical protein